MKGGMCTYVMSVCQRGRKVICSCINVGLRDMVEGITRYQVPEEAAERKGEEYACVCASCVHHCGMHVRKWRWIMISETQEAGGKEICGCLNKLKSKAQLHCMLQQSAQMIQALLVQVHSIGLQLGVLPCLARCRVCTHMCVHILQPHTHKHFHTSFTDVKWRGI